MTDIQDMLNCRWEIFEDWAMDLFQFVGCPLATFDEHRISTACVPASEDIGNHIADHPGPCQVEVVIDRGTMKHTWGRFAVRIFGEPTIGSLGNCG